MEGTRKQNLSFLICKMVTSSNNNTSNNNYPTSFSRIIGTHKWQSTCTRVSLRISYWYFVDLLQCWVLYMHILFNPPTDLVLPTPLGENWDFKWLRFTCLTVTAITIVTLLEEKEMNIPVGITGLREWESGGVPAYWLRGRVVQWGAGTQEKG